MKQIVGITLDENLVRLIDEQRRSLSRSSYVNEMLWQNLEKGITLRAVQ
ncbi:MAG: hypothetical protein MIO93_11075 [ANME-2 cluster archaeon]|jgi:metal-responsive CopG/Arc/MetJ family transcriptional regulator|nr:hypothetical protein [ANME-2 cluster archaeon]